MSYILDALKKADQERDIGAVPNLATPSEVQRPQTRSYGWLWVVLVLLSVNIVLVALLLKDGDSEVPVAVQATPERQPSLAEDQSARPTQPFREVTAGVAPMPQESAPPKNARTRSAGELVVLPEPAPLQDPKPLSPSEEVSNGRMGARAAAQDAAQLPSWYELPQEFRNQLDVPHPDLHVYSEEPQNRFILVNLKKYREGETLDSGLVLEEILPDGMVMSYRGKRFTVEK